MLRPFAVVFGFVLAVGAIAPGLTCVWQASRFSAPEGVAREGDTIHQNDLTRIGDLIVVPNWQPGTVTASRIVP